MQKAGFCEMKFRSMLLTSTLTLSVMYIMLLCDTIVAGMFVGPKGVAAINAITPVTGLITFSASIFSIGTGIVYSREIGAMRKSRADEIFSLGLVLNVGISVLTAVLLLAFRNEYFEADHLDGEILELASAYYRWTPLNAVLAILNSYLTKLVYTDGDEKSTTFSYIVQIGSNLFFSVLLARSYGMAGIILGTIIGNFLGILAVCRHFFLKSSTLHFVPRFSFADTGRIMRYSVVDAAIYICWGVMDYVLIGHVSARYGQAGEITLAVVVGLLEFGIVLDGVGMAAQPLLQTYLGEENRKMVRRLIRDAMKAAVLEGLAANVLVFAFARPFCALFGITGGPRLTDAVRALRIVSFGLVFCSVLSLLTSYYLLTDHIRLSVGIIVLKDGLFYTLLPLLGSRLLGQDGMWAAFAVAPLLAFLLTCLWIRLRYGRKSFPHLMEMTEDREIVVMDELLAPESASRLSILVNEEILNHGHRKETAAHASLFTEEIVMNAWEYNRKRRRPPHVEITLLFGADDVRLIERDNGEILDSTDPNMRINGIGSYVLSRLMNHQESRLYLTTTGYNRIFLDFR